MIGPIYRIPPVLIGSRVFLPSEVKDKKPWGLVERNIPKQWRKTKGEGVTVAILDTGVWRHKDLPDPVFAWNATGKGSVFDKHGHATHVAGIVGARLDGSGVVGWAPECNLAAVKVLTDAGWGEDKWIADGIRYATKKGANIINLSLGGKYSGIIGDAVRDAVKAGVVVICAAGNEGPNPMTVASPAAMRETIAIGSYRQDGKISSFSSRGPEVDFAFPGEKILSTYLNNSYRILSGTSMACPAAAGLAALVLASSEKKPDTEGIRKLFKQSAEDRGPKGKDYQFGWGIVDSSGVVRGGEPKQKLGKPIAETDGAKIYPYKEGDREGLLILFD